MTAKKGWAGSRVYSDGRYFQTDLAKFEEAMGTLVDNMKINILQKDNVGNVKWCGVVMMFTKPSIHGRRDDGTGDVGQWAVGDTIEFLPDCHGNYHWAFQFFLIRGKGIILNALFSRIFQNCREIGVKSIHQENQ